METPEPVAVRRELRSDGAPDDLLPARAADVAEEDVREGDRVPLGGIPLGWPEMNVPGKGWISMGDMTIADHKAIDEAVRQGAPLVRVCRDPDPELARRRAEPDRYVARQARAASGDL